MDASKLDEILSKLDDISLLRAELKEFKQEITQTLKKQEERLDCAFHELNELKETQQGDSVRTKQRIDYVNDRLGELRQDFENECIYTKLYSYKYNLLFSGIPGDETDRYESEQALRQFWRDTLGVDDSEIYLADVHRMGQNSTGRPRTMVAKFIQMRDRDHILNQGKHLKNYRSNRTLADGKKVSWQTYSIQEHLPPQLVERKKGLMPAFRQAASMGLRRRFKVVGADIGLFINGQRFIHGMTEITQNGLRGINKTNTHLRFTTSSPINNSSTLHSSASDSTVMDTDSFSHGHDSNDQSASILQRET